MNREIQLINPLRIIHLIKVLLRFLLRLKTPLLPSRAMDMHLLLFVPQSCKGIPHVAWESRIVFARMVELLILLLVLLEPGTGASFVFVWVEERRGGVGVGDVVGVEVGGTGVAACAGEVDALCARSHLALGSCFHICFLCCGIEQKLRSRSAGE